MMLVLSLVNLGMNSLSFKSGKVNAWLVGNKIVIESCATRLLSNAPRTERTAAMLNGSPVMPIDSSGQTWS